MFKKMVSIIVCMFLFLSITLPASAQDGQAYEIVVPFEYGGIQSYSLEHELFVSFVSAQRKTAGLYTFAGELLMQEEHIVLFRDYIVVKKETGMGVLNTKLEEIIPCIYGDIAFLDEKTVLAIEADKQDRNLVWSGNRTRYDLLTGNVIGDDGYGAYWNEVAMPDGNNLRSIIWYDLVRNVGSGWFDSGDNDPYNTSVSVENEDGQLLLDTVPGVSARPSVSQRTFLVNRDQTTALYSGRGRFLYEGASNQTTMVCDGRYFVTFDGVSSVLKDWNGANLLPAGTFTNIYELGPVFDNQPEDSDTLYLCVTTNRDEASSGIIRMKEIGPVPSAWAVGEAEQAVAAGLVDKDIQWWWRDSCTREEFCRMMVRAIEKRTQKTAAQLTANMEAIDFIDTDSAAVSHAAMLGVVDGIGAGKFAPGKFVTRQEAATMLARTASYLNCEASGEPLAFADESSFAPWATEAISTVSAILCGEDSTPLMNGTGNDFSPLANFTVEQAAATALRMTQVN